MQDLPHRDHGEAVIPHQSEKQNENEGRLRSKYVFWGIQDPLSYPLPQAKYKMNGRTLFAVSSLIITLRYGIRFVMTPILHYRKIGKGPYLIILHGLYGMSDNWMGIARSISKHFTVILPDMRNHGRSFHHPVHTYAAMAEDVENLAVHLGIKSFFLAGHSMGGKAAMHYSFLHPERLNGLLVFDIAPANYPTNDNNYQSHVHILESMNSISAAHLTSREEAMEALGSLLPDIRLLNFLLKNLGRNPDGTFYWMLNLPVLIGALKELALGFSHPPENITGFPVHFIRGAKSYYVEPNYIQAAHRIYPGCEIHAVPDAGHWLHQEQPDIVSDLIIKLLSL